MHRDPLDQCLTTDEINASTKHNQTSSITTCHHQRKEPNCTLSCCATMVEAQDPWLVHSDSPVPLWRLEVSLNEHGVAPTDLQQPNVGTFPNPSRWTIPIAAAASDLITTWPHKQRSFKIDCSPIPSVAALTTAANSGLSAAQGQDSVLDSSQY